MRNLLVIAMLILGHTAYATDYQLQTVARGLDRPWSLAFLPNGDYLVSFLGGEIRQIGKNGQLGPALKNTPPTYFKSQGGYFDVLLDQDFVDNQRLFLAFAYGTPQANATRVISATLANNSLLDVTPIFTVKNPKDTPVHYGGKLLQLSDGTLLVTTGDGFDYREAAQDPRSQLGKIIRINTDGSIPKDNPFANGKKADPLIFTLGHRNPQGLALDPRTGVIFMHEHGPKGGDELNIVTGGNNYGWPIASYGVNYSGAKITPFETLTGVTDAIKFWRPSIAPSGMAVYSGDAFPDWQGDLFIGALVDKEVRRLQLKNNKVVAEHRLFSELGQRVRDVRVSPDGFLYLLTETKDGVGGRLLKVMPTTDD